MHLLLDVLLTDIWSMALVKVTLATQEARSDIQFTRQHIVRFDMDDWTAKRRRCGHFVRRLHRDEQGLDLLWLMLAASPGKPWTYAGWMPRLTDAFNAMELTQVEEGLLKLATDRYEKWTELAGGFPAIQDDPFKAVLPKEWAKAEMARRDLEKEARAEAAIAENLSRATGSAWRGRSLIQELGSTPEPEVEVVQGAVWEQPPGVQVLPPSFKASGLYKQLVDQRTHVGWTTKMSEIRNALRNEFPHALAAIDMMLVDLRDDEPVAFRPFVLLGDAGCGKSRMVRRLAELLDMRLRRYDAAGSADNAFAGTPKRWHSATPCFPLQVVAELGVANPIVLVDEIDKAGVGFSAGSLGMALMPFLEKETSQAYPDPCLEVEADLSHLNYAMTANDVLKLPSPLRDRLRIIRVPSPGVEHLESLSRSILADLAVEMNVPAAFLMPLAQDELSVVAKAWGDNGSVRKLQKIVRGTVTARDQHAVRH